ncbi:hypothetical protein PR048_001404 [Dryococelus australis]|uniref:Uncharacterized protein n=1 Tax=Dryococelus australis TaxID=614101 RepID=A0ABQ9IJN7_9NEOP|nr:hypothetical protein PR048_001404 [Dryococelus australis]
MRVKRGEYGALPKCKGGEFGDPRGNPPISGIVRHDPHMRNSGANRVRFPARSLPGLPRVGVVPDDAAGRQAFLGISRSPAPSLRRCSILTSITLIGSQDLAVKNRPNLFTHSTPPFSLIRRRVELVGRVGGHQSRRGTQLQ